MDKQKLVKKLKEFIEKNKLKNSKVETDLGLPKNSLSNFLSEKKALPDKWINPIMKYALGDLADKVTTADKIEPIVYEVTKSNNFGFSELKPMVNTIKFEVAEWIKEVETYCGELGILPNDLILCHKERNKPQKSKKGTNTSKDGEIGSTEAGSAKNNRSNWFKDYKKLKTGISE